MKKLIVLGLSALMLAACGGNAAIDTPLEASEGEAKLTSIYEGMESALGNKCVEMVTAMDIQAISEESSGMSVSVTASGSQRAQFDLPDNVSYMYDEFSATVSISSDAYSMDMESSGVSETWAFDGKLASKTAATVTMMGVTTPSTEYSIDDTEGTAKDFALETLYELTDYIDNVNWGSVTYYGNSNEGDLRVVASNGYIGTSRVDAFEVTYQDGLPREVVITQNADVADVGYDTPITSTSTITYPDSLNISTPDLTSEEWANA